jgi:hypothetical protein
MDDDAVARRSEVDHLAHRCGIFVPSHNDGAGLDLPGVTGLIEEGPDVAGLVFIVEVWRAVPEPFSARISICAEVAAAR